MVIRHWKQFTIETYPRGHKNKYIVRNHNLKQGDGIGHTHLRNKGECKMAIKHILDERLPDRKDLRFLNSLIRIADNRQYKEKLIQLRKTRKQKGPKQKYYNVKKGAHVVFNRG